jgi:phage shock protein PspC (stress-responsive transcriptional regulator)
MNETPQIRRLTRSDDKMLFGVCGGLARYFNVDPLLTRIAFTAFALALGSGIALYVIAALIMPRADGGPSKAEEWLEGRDRSQAFIGAALVIAAIAVLLGGLAPGWGDWGGWGHGGAWIIALVVAGGLLWFDHQRREQIGDLTPDPETAATAVQPGPSAPPPAPKQPSLTLPGIAALLIGAGICGLLSVGAGVDVPLDIALASAVILIGGIAIYGARSGRRALGLAALGVMLIPFTVAAAATDFRFGDGAGERILAPFAASDLDRDQRLGAGSLQLDLRQTELPAGTTSFKGHVAMGQLIVRVPYGVGVSVEGHIDAGEATVLGKRDDGISVRTDRETTGYVTAKHRLDLDLDVGFGRIVVVRGDESIDRR